jgi:prevent-host-death family protein
LYNIEIKMHTINISEFRANLLQYLEKVNAGEEISVASNGRLLATLIPPTGQKEAARKQLQALAANAKIHDVISPIHADWDALS